MTGGERKEGGGGIWCIIDKVRMKKKIEVSFPGTVESHFQEPGGNKIRFLCFKFHLTIIVLSCAVGFEIETLGFWSNNKYVCLYICKPPITARKKNIFPVFRM